MADKIKSKQFKVIYPDFATFESKVKVPILDLELGSSTLKAPIAAFNDLKMFYKWKTIYKLIYNHYKNYFSVYEDADTHDVMVNSLTQLLQELHVQCIRLGTDFITKLSVENLFSNQQKNYQEKPETNKFKTTIKTTQTQIQKNLEPTKKTLTNKRTTIDSGTSKYEDSDKNFLETESLNSISPQGSSRDDFGALKNVGNTTQTKQKDKRVQKNDSTSSVVDETIDSREQENTLTTTIDNEQVDARIYYKEFIDIGKSFNDSAFADINAQISKFLNSPLLSNIWRKYDPQEISQFIVPIDSNQVELNRQEIAKNSTKIQTNINDIVALENKTQNMSASSTETVFTGGKQLVSTGDFKLSVGKDIILEDSIGTFTLTPAKMRKWDAGGGGIDPADKAQITKNKNDISSLSTKIGVVENKIIALSHSSVGGSVFSGSLTINGSIHGKTTWYANNTQFYPLAIATNTTKIQNISATSAYTLITGDLKVSGDYEDNSGNAIPASTLIKNVGAIGVSRTTNADDTFFTTKKYIQFEGNKLKYKKVGSSVYSEFDLSSSGGGGGGGSSSMIVGTSYSNAGGLNAVGNSHNFAYDLTTSDLYCRVEATLDNNPLLYTETLLMPVSYNKNVYLSLIYDSTYKMAVKFNGTNLSVVAKTGNIRIVNLDLVRLRASSGGAGTSIDGLANDASKSKVILSKPFEIGNGLTLSFLKTSASTKILNYSTLETIDSNKAAIPLIEKQLARHQKTLYALASEKISDADLTQNKPIFVGKKSACFASGDFTTTGDKVDYNGSGVDECFLLIPSHKMAFDIGDIIEKFDISGVNQPFYTCILEIAKKTLPDGDYYCSITPKIIGSSTTYLDNANHYIPSKFTRTDALYQVPFALGSESNNVIDSFQVLMEKEIQVDLSAEISKLTNINYNAAVGTTISGAVILGTSGGVLQNTINHNKLLQMENLEFASGKGIKLGSTTITSWSDVGGIPGLNFDRANDEIDQTKSFEISNGVKHYWNKTSSPELAWGYDDVKGAKDTTLDAQNISSVANSTTFKGKVILVSHGGITSILELPAAGSVKIGNSVIDESKIKKWDAGGGAVSNFKDVMLETHKKFKWMNELTENITNGTQGFTINRTSSITATTDIASGSSLGLDSLLDGDASGDNWYWTAAQNLTNKHMTFTYGTAIKNNFFAWKIKGGNFLNTGFMEFDVYGVSDANVETKLNTTSYYISENSTINGMLGYKTYQGDIYGFVVYFANDTAYKKYKIKFVSGTTNSVPYHAAIGFAYLKPDGTFRS